MYRVLNKPSEFYPDELKIALTDPLHWLYRDFDVGTTGKLYYASSADDTNAVNAVYKPVSINETVGKRLQTVK